MPIQYRELSKHLSGEVSLAAFATFLETALSRFGFDEETLFDTVLEEGDGRRTEGETRRDRVVALFTEELWPGLRQVVLSNQWIKGMNLKVHWIRRLRGSTLTVTWDLDAPEKTAALAVVLEAALEAFSHSACAQPESSQAAELEHLFGSMLLVESVAAASREAFLNGDFRACLAAAHRVLEKRLGVLLGAPVKRMGDLEELFRREPPCFLLPELSGSRLHVELTGLVHVLMGLELLLQPLLQGREKAPADPAPVLKKLVLISLLVERLETATRNPAAVQTPPKRAKRTRRAQPPRARQAAGAKRTRILKKTVRTASLRPAAKSRLRGKTKSR
jgi:hypothetical protein